jgi:two-component system, NtrC family, response regulator AtoC
LREYPNLPKRVLVVGREMGVFASTQHEVNGCRIEAVDSGWEALERVQKELCPDLIVLDSAASESEALHILRWLRRVRPEVAIVLLGCEENGQLQHEAMRAGAHDYVGDPRREERWNLLVRRHLSNQALVTEPDFDATTMEQVGEDLFFIAATPSMAKLRMQVELLAQVNAPVLIFGEPGTGKELAARLIHKLSVRSGFRFARVNCALPGDLLHRDLFGDGLNRNGRSKPGKVELCHRGTLFLDGIGDLPLGVQASLLNLLQNGAETAGDRAYSDVRILAASDGTISDASASKRIREDLYYRLSVFILSVPPLRERRSEIPVLLTLFLNQLSKRYGLPVPIVPPALREASERYSWPGNLRELELFAKRYLVTGNHEQAIAELNPKEDRHVLLASHSIVVQGSDEDAALDDRTSGLKWLVQNATGTTERNAIVTALSRTHWNRKAAARLLKVSYRTLLYKIERYRLTPPLSISEVPRTGTS